MLFYSTIWDGIPKFALFVAVAIILVSLADWLPKIIRNPALVLRLSATLCVAGVARLTHRATGK